MQKGPIPQCHSRGLAGNWAHRRVRSGAAPWRQDLLEDMDTWPGLCTEDTEPSHLCLCPRYPTAPWDSPCQATRMGRREELGVERVRQGGHRRHSQGSERAEDCMQAAEQRGTEQTMQDVGRTERRGLGRGHLPPAPDSGAMSGRPGALMYSRPSGSRPEPYRVEGDHF